MPRRDKQFIRVVFLAGRIVFSTVWNYHFTRLSKSPPNKRWITKELTDAEPPFIISFSPKIVDRFAGVPDFLRLPEKRDSTHRQRRRK